MASPDNQPPPACCVPSADLTTFDPARWVAEWEAAGGKVSVIDRGERGQWIGRTIPRGAIDLLRQAASAANQEAVAAYIVETRGVVKVGD